MRLARTTTLRPTESNFIMVQEKPQTQIHVVQNWFEELKARVPTYLR